MSYNLEELINEFQRRTRENRIGTLFHNREAYPKAMEFFKAGATYKQRLYRAANRIGV